MHVKGRKFFEKLVFFVPILLILFSESIFTSQTPPFDHTTNLKAHSLIWFYSSIMDPSSHTQFSFFFVLSQVNPLFSFFFFDQHFTNTITFSNLILINKGFFLIHLSFPRLFDRLKLYIYFCFFHLWPINHIFGSSSCIFVTFSCSSKY